ncbi:MAG TPA: glycosyltransferase family 39 protein [Deltaproteobacteria bacterium]|nr:glycosyltransferase family 39 protein [Deltaproteobacteria bacterium]
MDTPPKALRRDEPGNARHLALVLLFLLAASVVIRLPFFFPVVIDWDESTYILWGQSVLDGHLPYTEMWGFKPPLAFAFYACAIGAFGKSIVSVRIAGTLCVALAAFFTYLAGRRLWNESSGMAAATLCIVIATFVKSGKAVMTEHAAMVPLAAALCILVLRGLKPRTAFCAGILMAVATFTRLNLAYTAVFIGLLVVVAAFAGPSGSLRSSLRCGAAYAAGGILVLLLVFLPYAVTGQQGLWWSSVILAPLSYASSQLSFSGAFVKQMSDTAAGVLVVLGGLAGLAAMVARWKTFPETTRRGAFFLMGFFFSTEFSILRSGASYPHYLIQLAPFAALAVAALPNAVSSGRTRRSLNTAVVFLAMALSVLIVLPAYKGVICRVLTGQGVPYGAAYDIASYLEREKAPGESVYLLTDHIVYWLIDEKPLSKSTIHPANITREYLLAVLVGPGTTTEQELSRILAKKPRFIVTGKRDYLRRKPAAWSLLQETLRTRYTLVKQVEGRKIYRRTAP